MIEKVIYIVKTHKDDFGIVFNTDVFNESDFLKIAENVVKLFTISDVINRREQLIYFFYDIEDDFDMGISTETLDGLVDELLKIN
jgi:hypothetical protein